MKRLLWMGLALLAGCIALSSCHQPAKTATFTQAQLDKIEQVSSQYLIKHPEILIKVSQALQKQQMQAMTAKLTSAALLHKNTLLNDATTPSFKPANAKVALIEFYDLNCAYCHKIAPAITAVMKANPTVEVVYKDFPIFASRWSSSQYGAEMEVALYKLGGFPAFIDFHHAVFDSGKMEGKLTVNDINTFARQAAKAHHINFTTAQTLSKTFTPAVNAVMKLGGQDIGFQGTPGVIVMPINSVEPTKTTVFPGYTTQAQLQEAIEKAKA